MTIRDVIERRRIREVLHFTTNRGLLGILHTSGVLSKARLGEEQQLEYIFQSNTAFRKDTAWLDYVNLSISSINSGFFEISSNRWHKGKDLWWCIVSFSPDILMHPQVHFATTNNMYSGVQQALGEGGLEHLFAPRVVQWHSSIVTRLSELPNHFPTCEQAEVLYPKMVSTEHLRAVYVRSDHEADEISGQVAVTAHPPIQIIVDPSRFKSRTW